MSRVLRGVTPRLGVARVRASHPSQVPSLLRGNTNIMGLQYTLPLACLNHTQLAGHSTVVSINLFFEHSLKKYTSLFFKKASSNYSKVRLGFGEANISSPPSPF